MISPTTRFDIQNLAATLVSDYLVPCQDIDPIFGTMEDFEVLAAAAKERGLRVVMDFVPNHSSNEHEWFLRSEAREEPYTDYYVWRDRNDSNPSNAPHYITLDSNAMRGRRCPQQLGERVPRLGLGVEREEAAVLLPRLHQGDARPQQLTSDVTWPGATRPQLLEPRGAAGDGGRPPVLDRQGGGRVQVRPLLKCDAVE